MKQEYQNISKNCFCEKCKRKIKINESVFANNNWVNICKGCYDNRKV
jgi:hypothetical protein